MWISKHRLECALEAAETRGKYNYIESLTCEHEWDRWSDMKKESDLGFSIPMQTRSCKKCNYIEKHII